MAGNRTRFEEARQKANDLVWEERWSEAIKAYRRALAEFPKDVATLRGYAWALFNAGELEEATKVYRRLTELAPNEPGSYERLAELLLRQGQGNEAAQLYAQAAAIFAEQELTDKQIEALETSVRLQPHNVDAWSTLLKHYRREGLVKSAVLATSWLAYLYQDEHPQWAVEVCRQTQELAPQSRRLGRLLRLLQSGQPLPQPPPTDELGDALELLPDEEEALMEDEVGSPTAIARQRALESLAESIFEGAGPQPAEAAQVDVAMLISRAVDAQTRGDLTAATEAYEELLSSGVSMASVHFNLGLIYKEQMRFQQAIAQLEKALEDEAYVLGAHFALGECYQAEGLFDEALKHFLEVIKLVDMTTVEREQVDDLLRVYEGLAQNLINRGEPERVEEILSSVVGFLGQRGWEEEAIRARRRLDSLARSGAVLSLAEVISLPNSEEVLHAVARSQEYLRRERPYLALEELIYAVGKAPFYLPVHTMLAQLFIENHRLDAALEKYRHIAKTCEVRGQMPQALVTYQQMLEYSPLDSNVRRRVIEILIQRGQIDEALEQYLQLADTYYQLAQADRARETYRRALALAPRTSEEQVWKLRILHRLADLDMQRLAWLDAIKDYEEITRIAPDDERAHLALLRLYTRTNRPRQGMAALDRLIKRYLQTKRLSKALAVLEDLVDEQPASIPLRFRAAQLNLKAGKREAALRHLDVLGDLQLEKGQEQAALKTIQTIIQLNPPNAEAYAELYQELSGRQPPST
ncbi:MAG: tetratricopeptide repeat protein [Anaerolineae bacterium]